MSEMTEMTIIVPSTVADDIDYYAEDCGLYADGDELAADAVRSMLIDVTAGYKSELDELLEEYNEVRKAQKPEMFKLRVTREMAQRIDRMLPIIGYDLNAFVSIAFMRRVIQIADFEDDEAERFGDVDEPEMEFPRVG